MLALDPAATEFFKNGKYELEGEGKTLDAGGMVDFYADLVTRYPDRLDRGRHGRGRLGRLEGAHRRARREDPARRRRPVRHQPRAPGRRASRTGVANAILVKVNQIGTLTETLDAVEMARTRRLHARSSRTAPARPRTRPSPTSPSRPTAARSRPARCRARTALAKYNQLLRIEEQLGTAGALRRHVDPARRLGRLERHLVVAARSRRSSVSTARASGSTMALSMSGAGERLDRRARDSQRSPPRTRFGRRPRGAAAMRRDGRRAPSATGTTVPVKCRTVGVGLGRRLGLAAPEPQRSWRRELVARPRSRYW